MSIINITVENKIATNMNEDTIVVCGNSDYTVKFIFDSEWDEYATKTAHFIYNGITVNVPFVGDTVRIPTLSNTTRVFVGVSAGDIRSTTDATIKCRKSILCKAGAPKPPSDDTYQELMEILKAGRISSTLVDDNGDLIVTLENGEVFNAGHCVGPQGPAGVVDYTKCATKEELATAKKEANNIFAGALKGEVTGKNAVVLEDISSVEHDINVSTNNISLPNDGLLDYSGDVSIPDDEVLHRKMSITLPAGTYTADFTKVKASMWSDPDLGYSVEPYIGLVICDDGKYGYSYIKDDKYGDIFTTLNSIMTFTLEKETKICPITTMVGSGSEDVFIHYSFSVKITLTKGTKAEPYVENLSLSQYGKNLMDISTFSNGMNCIYEKGIGSIYITKDNISYTSFFVANMPALFEKLDGQYLTFSVQGVPLDCFVSVVVKYSDGELIEYYGTKGTNYTTFLLNNKSRTISYVKFFPAKSWGTFSHAGVELSKIQLELGNKATEYQPYIEPIECEIDKVTHRSPYMALVSNTSGVTLNVKYNRDINIVADKLEKRLAAVEEALI